MAAHSFRIAKQILEKIRCYEAGEPIAKGLPVVTAEHVVSYADAALNAPGTDDVSYPCLRLTVRPDGELSSCLFSLLYAAANGLIDTDGERHYGLKDEDLLPVADRVPFIRAACEAIVRQCFHLKHYRSLEAANSAYKRYVRRGKPYWRKRNAMWQRFPWGAEDRPEPEHYYQ